MQSHFGMSLHPHCGKSKGGYVGKHCGGWCGLKDTYFPVLYGQVFIFAPLID